MGQKGKFTVDLNGRFEVFILGARPPALGRRPMTEDRRRTGAFDPPVVNGCFLFNTLASCERADVDCGSPAFVGS
jgi:hypothetical protein